MEYLGHTQTANYMTNAPSCTSNQSTVLPASLNMRRSLTNLPWRSSTFYQTARVNHSTALASSTTAPFNVRSSLGELEGIKVPPIFNAARNALYTRYTPNDWMHSNLANYTTSDKVRSNGERVRYDTLRLAKESDDITKRAQEESGKKLGDRLTDISFWKNELNSETDKMIAEQNALADAKRVAEKVLSETENPLHVAQECLYNREKRQGIDLVHDQVEKNLLNEVDCIQLCQEKIRQVIGKSNAQINLNRAAQHELERDSADKFVAQQIDTTCHGMKNTSAGIAFHNGVETVDNTLSIPETWAKYSNDNIQRSQAERTASKDIRAEIENVINECANDMLKHWNACNAALSQRIQESTDARNKLQTHLSKTLQEIFDMEKNIEFIKKSIHDKNAPMQVAQSRLDTRIRRPNVELCRDPAQHRLVLEVHEIRNTVENLQQQLREAENALQHLLRTKGALEQDLRVKNTSIFIDREKCLGVRKTFPLGPRISCY